MINPHIMKIIIAARKTDSINAISKRAGISFGWTHKWVTELAREGVVKPSRMMLTINTKNLVYKKTLAYIKAIFRQDIRFYYSVLSLMGIVYCFTKTDAVFVWTKGGYQIGRSKEYYPIFAKIRKQDKKIFEDYVRKLGLQVNAKRGVFFHPEFVQDFPIEMCENIPVDPLEDTIAFMKKQFYNFQPALEMIQEMYGMELGVHYKEIWQL